MLHKRHDANPGEFPIAYCAENQNGPFSRIYINHDSWRCLQFFTNVISSSSVTGYFAPSTSLLTSRVRSLSNCGRPRDAARVVDPACKRKEKSMCKSTLYNHLYFYIFV